MIPQLPKLFLILALFTFVSSQIAEGKKFECYTNNRNEKAGCARGQNLCVRASKCRKIQEIRDDPTHFFGGCVWNENHAIEFCDDFLEGYECESCKICNTSKCNDDEQFMKEIGIDDENNKTKPSNELSSTEFNPFSSEFSSPVTSSMAPSTPNEFECYYEGNETVPCETGQNLCVRASKCPTVKHDPNFSLGSCVWSENHGKNFCDLFGGCNSCKICNTTKCNGEENDEDSITSTSSMPPSTPSGAISAFHNGPKWESFIPVAILMASAILLTAAIF